ncbi:hypothetical protein BJX99DRAFT_265053 [Aspergillus californicus]
MTPNFTFSLSALALTLLTTQALSQVYNIPAQPIPGALSNTQWISGPSAFDSPKNNPLNETAYDWWYFDIVSEPDANGQQPSFAASFHTTGTDGFDPLHGAIPGPYPSQTFVQIDLAWPDGETEAWILVAGDSTITVKGDGASGNFSGTGCAFHGAPDLSWYTIDVDAPEQGIVGSFQVLSNAPAHYPCGPAEAGQDLHIVPGAGWINAVPDGPAAVDFDIHGREFKFQGRGYHDHNFGNRAFSSALAASYWGHGRIADYVVVWADMLTPSGANHLTSYVAQNGEILTAECSGIRVRPYGENSTYPPTTTTGSPTGFHLEVNIPEGLLELQAETIYVTVASSFYHRFTGRFTGSLNGVPLQDGIALWEQFTLQEGDE